MKSYFITNEGITFIRSALEELADRYGLDMLYNYCPNAVANQAVGKADFDQDINLNGEFVHEIGAKSPRGTMLTITITKDHCEELSI